MGELQETIAKDLYDDKVEETRLRLYHIVCGNTSTVQPNVSVDSALKQMENMSKEITFLKELTEKYKTDISKLEVENEQLMARAMDLYHRLW